MWPPGPGLCSQASWPGSHLTVIADPNPCALPSPQGSRCECVLRTLDSLAGDGPGQAQGDSRIPTLSPRTGVRPACSCCSASVPTARVPLASELPFAVHQALVRPPRKVYPGWASGRRAPHSAQRPALRPLPWQATPALRANPRRAIPAPARPQHTRPRLLWGLGMVKSGRYETLPLSGAWRRGGLLGQ